MNAREKQESRPYDETLEAARSLDDIASSPRKQRPTGDQKQHSHPQADKAASLPPEGSGKTEPPSAAATPGQPAHSDLPPSEEKKEPSIGELFSKLVRMSPQDKIRIEQDSIGSLFKKYISKRG